MQFSLVLKKYRVRDPLAMGGRGVSSTWRRSICLFMRPSTWQAAGKNIIPPRLSPWSSKTSELTAVRASTSKTSELTAVRASTLKTSELTVARASTSKTSELTAEQNLYLGLPPALSLSTETNGPPPHSLSGLLFVCLLRALAAHI